MDELTLQYAENLKPCSFGCPNSIVLDKDLMGRGTLYKKGSIVCKGSLSYEMIDDDCFDYRCNINYLMETDNGLVGKCRWNHSEFNIAVNNFSKK